MNARTEHPIVVHRRREADAQPVNDRMLRCALQAGAVVRVAAGCYVRSDDWERLRPIDRHDVRVLEAADRARGEVVIALFAAAAVWGIDILGRWPGRVDVRVDRAGGGRSTGIFQRRAWGFDGVAVLPWRGHWITTPAQTVVDLARVLSFRSAVVVADQALWARRLGGPLTDRAVLMATREHQPAARGDAGVERMLRFSTHLSDSVRESQSRVVIDALGFPEPVLQDVFELPHRGTAKPDFFFEDFDHAAEFDGTGKYLDPELTRGLTPEQALLAEKDRGDALRRRVRALSRWRTPALRQPALLYDILTGDGLPTPRPRPRPGMVWQ
ncbi:hypothetical protein ABCS02_09430 [Microbacterium sp. X-17]|uniref:hypothetical protein n=1 Tax=Microbacterium sp. X-17 TaxID=3144404 RepID=UPI0031F4F234